MTQCSNSRVKNVEEQWSNFKNAVHVNAKSIIGHQRGSWEEQWISNETWNLIDNGNKIKFQRNQALYVNKAVEI